MAWGRAVKSRGRWQRATPPPLWLFSDPLRIPDLLAAVTLLPRGLCGVVFRHDAAEGRAHLARAVQQACRQRRLVMVVAGQPVGGGWAGRHLRQGRGVAGHRFTTSSCHDVPAIRRARGAGAQISFLSPTFPTASHPGQPALGILRWSLLARRMTGIGVFALGGIDGGNVRRLPRWVRGAGAIGALGP